MTPQPSSRPSPDRAAEKDRLLLSSDPPIEDDLPVTPDPNYYVEAAA